MIVLGLVLLVVGILLAAFLGHPLADQGGKLLVVLGAILLVVGVILAATGGGSLSLD